MVATGLFAAAPGEAAAQTSGQRDVVITKDGDYFGGDYKTLKNLDLDGCKTACTFDNQCKAFTYNSKSRWCFLKNSVGTLQSAAGATAGEIVVAPAVDRASLAARGKELSFLPADALASANRERLRLIEADRDPLLKNESTTQLAMEAAAAPSFVEGLDRWREILKRQPLANWAWQGLVDTATATGKFEQGDGPPRHRFSLLNAAINAYLTASTDAEKARALAGIGRYYEKKEDWKPAIHAYRMSVAAKADPFVVERLNTVVGAHGFRIVDHTVDNNAASPRICLVFSDQLSRKLTGSDHPGDYLSVQGGETLPVTATGNQLCVGGLEHGRSYHITARPGISATDGETLRKQVDLSVYVKDRDPTVRFTTSAYVVPAGGKTTISVVTVNVDTIDARVQRIGERGLADMLTQGQFLTNLSRWQINQISSQSGQDVWTGSVSVVRNTNTDVTTAIPIADMVPDLKPGVYVLTAQVANAMQTPDPFATQWFVVSDIGLSTFSGSNGFDIVARSLGSAAPLAGVTIDLVATNNQILGMGATDAQGHLRLPAGLMRGLGGDKPALLIARKDKDFVFLNLSDSPFDLTDRGVEGRAPAGAIDVFLTPDRGIYRVGDTAHFNALTRDKTGAAIAGLTLTAIVTRPDGVEHSRRTVSDFAAGGYAFDLSLSDKAMRGAWDVRLYTDPKKPAIGQTRFLVEDFEPQKLDFDISTPAKSFDPAMPPTIEVAARYLFGAPAAGLAVNGEVVVSASTAIAAYPGYSFGLDADKVTATRKPFTEAKTGPDGQAEVSIPPFDPPATTLPLTATLQLRVVDANGKPVEKISKLPLNESSERIGIKPRFSGAVAERSTAGFDVVAIDAAGQRVAARGLKWQLKQINVAFQWYENSGSWNYEPVETSKLVADGTVDVDAQDPVSLSVPVEWGGYELDVVDPSGRAIPASIRFDAGWYVAPTSVETPQIAEVSLDKHAYRIGETAKVRIESRFAGKAEIFVMDEGIIERTTADISAKGGEVELPVTKDWGTGAYVAAMVYRPMNLSEKLMPSRAIGIAYAKVDPGQRALTVAIEAPDTIRPRQLQTIGVTVDGIASGETAYVTLAAIDVGILNVTHFEPPSPQGYYFGQRRLGVAFRDLYSRLIDRTQGAPGTVRSGGDAGASYESPPPMNQLVSLYSGPVAVGADGHATITFDIPDFNGTMKLMAIAWSKSGVGEANRDMVVRDPIVIDVARPTFLAPGDTSRLAIDLTHVEGPTGPATLSVASDNSVVAFGGETEKTVSIAPTGQTRVLIPVSGQAIGDASIHVSLRMASGATFTKTVALSVRSNAPEIVQRSQVTLAARDGKLSLDPQLFTGFKPGTARATVSIIGAAHFDVAGIVQALDRYPYGCTEQLTSRALPLIYLDRMILAAGLGKGEDVKERVQQAISGVLANQSPSGSFGLWQPDSGDLWLDAYVTDFLTRAREAAYQVPQVSLKTALDNLKNSLAYLSDKPDWSAVAYAYYVLARNGSASIGDLRYYADNQLQTFPTPLAKAQLGAALALYGDRVRAERIFTTVVADLPKDNAEVERSDYGSPLRDDAAILTLAYETKIEGVSFKPLIEEINAAWAAYDDTSTQEDAWSLLAAHALLERYPPHLEVGGRIVDGPYSATIDASDLAKGFDIVNRGTSQQLASVTIFGVPEITPPASHNGFDITRKYYTLDGKPADPAKIKEGDRLVVVDEVTAIDTGPAHLMVNDPLPAGFAIDNPQILQSGDVAALDWLQLTSDTAHVEFRSDRFLAAVDVKPADPAVRRFAYIVRAIAPGSFVHPAATVENMYDPSRRGRTDAGRITVIGPLR
ncbi:alpha-2-macroglobulin family protein [Jiella sp. CQZ9-1]|uniref:Alpha-2-macroglobulin family protein n=1 Tax=Jiella flava TaxID=2816857 RepID=A0A939JUN6_9HYPH|nr:alpha-2-macroglobulin family protein [Jiella flava]MBO0661594.1 alpha-2-macroglobulin family protein [Jiella flava]